MKLTSDQIEYIKKNQGRISNRALAKHLGIGKADLKRAMRLSASAGSKSPGVLSFLTKYFDYQLLATIRQAEKKKYFWPIIIFLGAFSLRLGYFFSMKDDPIFRVPILDGAYYSNWANAILSGHDLTGTAYFVEPGYAWILAAFYKFFGICQSAQMCASTMTIIFFQFILSSLTGVIIFLTGRKLFNKSVGIIAALMIIGLRPLIFYDGLLLKTSVEMFLISLILLLSSHILGEGSKHLKLEARGVYGIFGLGFLIGLTAVVKANIFYVVPLLMLAVYLQSGRLLDPKGPKWTSRVLYPVTIFILGVIIPILPVTYHNWRVSRSFVLINYSGGPNLYIGNWYGSDGSLKPPEFISVSPDTEEKSWNKMAEGYLGENITPARVSSFWVGEALKEISQDPIFFLKNTGKKILLLFHPLPLDDNYSIEYMTEKFSWLSLAIPFWIVAYLGLGGLAVIISEKRRRGEFLWLYAIMLGYAVTLVASHVAERYRLALSPMFALLGGYLIYWLWKKIRTDDYARIFLIGIPMLIVLPLLFLDIGPTSRTMPADTWNNLGFEEMKRGRDDIAEQYFKNSLEKNPKLPMPYLNLGKIYLKAGKIDDALDNIRKSLRFRPDGTTAYLKIALEAKRDSWSVEDIRSQIDEADQDERSALFDPDYITAMKLLREQKYQEALAYLEKAKERHPDHGQLLTNIGIAYKNTNQLDLAKESLAQAIRADGYNLAARYNMVNVLRKRKENDLAMSQLVIINSMVPSYLLTEMQLAELYLAKNDTKRAKELYENFLSNKENAEQFPEYIPKAKDMLKKLSNSQNKINDLNNINK